MSLSEVYRYAVPLVDKHQGVVNVRSFGAKGDGVTDDAIAIQRAIDAAAGQTVMLPAGTYLIRSTLTLPSKTRLVGGGMDQTILQAGSAGVDLVQTANAGVACEVTGITFQGTGTVNMVQRGFFAVTADGPRVILCRFTNLTYAVQFAGALNGLVRDSRFEGIVGQPGISEGYGILCNGGARHAIRDNVFLTVQRHCVYLSNGCSYSVVSGNRMTDVHNAMIQVYATGAQPYCQRNVIADNVLDNCQYSPGFAGAAVGVIIAERVQDTVVSNNVISRVQDYGIVISGIAGSEPQGHNIIKGNRIVCQADTQAAIEIYNCGMNLVEGNHITGPGLGTINLILLFSDGGRNTNYNRFIANDLYDGHTGVFFSGAGTVSNVAVNNIGRNLTFITRDTSGGATNQNIGSVAQ